MTITILKTLSVASFNSLFKWHNTKVYSIKDLSTQRYSFCWSFTQSQSFLMLSTSSVCDFNAHFRVEFGENVDWFVDFCLVPCLYSFLFSACHKMLFFFFCSVRSMQNVLRVALKGRDNTRRTGVVSLPSLTLGHK